MPHDTAASLSSHNLHKSYTHHNTLYFLYHKLLSLRAYSRQQSNHSLYMPLRAASCRGVCPKPCSIQLHLDCAYKNRTSRCHCLLNWLYHTAFHTYLIQPNHHYRNDKYNPLSLPLSQNFSLKTPLYFAYALKSSPAIFWQGIRPRQPQQFQYFYPGSNHQRKQTPSPSTSVQTRSVHIVLYSPPPCILAL